jgi:hypothetical protein
MPTKTAPNEGRHRRRKVLDARNGFQHLDSSERLELLDWVLENYPEDVHAWMDRQLDEAAMAQLEK